ncbi:PTS fructose transporter subunit IIC [Orbus sturtevantii]
MSSKQKSSAMKDLMNGVSHMIPFVVVGGLFIAIAAAIGGENLPGGLEIPLDSIWQKISDIGVIGFGLMIPIFAGYIAYAIAGRAALAPAMISAQVANSPEILGTEAGTGFLGAIVVGFLAGYLVKWMNTWKIPKDLRAVMPTVVIPILGTAIICGLLILVLGQPISWLMTNLNGLLETLSHHSSISILLGVILGAMLGIDMGGPINKVAYLFGVASITTGNPMIMGVVAAVIGVPPLALGISTFYLKKYSPDEKSAGTPAILMGMLGITEGAIPFAAANPKVVIPSIVCGSAVTGALAMLFKVTIVIPNGGPVAGILGASNNVALYLLAILLGIIAVNLFLILFSAYFKRGKTQNEN